MTTVMTNRMSSSGRNRHFLHVTSNLPFPTTAALPDRRAKLKATDLSLVRQDSIRLVSRFLTSKSPTTYSDGDESRESCEQAQLNNMTVVSNNEKMEVKSSKDNNNKARRSHRNIVTPRWKNEDSCTSSLASSSILSFNIFKSDNHLEDGESKLFMPTRRNRKIVDPPSLPQGVFLTDLAFEDSPTHTESIIKSSSSLEEADNSTSASTWPESRTYWPQDKISVFTKSGDNSPSSRAVATRNPFVLQRVYLEGLDYMRSHVLNVEREVDVINRKFHKVTASGIDEDWLHYISKCNQHLLQANSSLLKSGTTLEVLDNEARLVKLLNNLRADTQPNKSLVESLTQFWDELKTTTQELQELLDKFSCTVVQRFRHNYISNHISELQVPVCKKYTMDIQQFLQDLDLQLNNVRLLLKNYRNATYDNLATKSTFSERLMVSCDLKAFPILGFVNDICGQISSLCQRARRWLERDEEFMHEVHEFIRVTRAAASQRQQILYSQKIKQKKVEKSVKIVNNVLDNNREKLRLIEVELQELEKKLTDSKEKQKARLIEIHQKENMMDFLKVTLQQTRKNCRLQAKRSKLLKQVKELEDYLKSMEADLEITLDQILVKSHEKILLKEKIDISEKSYGVLKSDLDQYSENLEELEAEVSGLSGQLLQLEIVHTIRTSPEILDNLTDRPSTVKLSKSLKERIKQRLRKSVT